MQFALTFTAEDARTISMFIASILVPFVVSFLKRANWPDWAKLSLALAVSGVGGFLAVYSDGSLMSVTSIVLAFAMIFSASQGHYAKWFAGTPVDTFLTNIFGRAE